MLHNEIIINRLALIKFLYNIGVQQSEFPDPASSFSILSFHDSIEMFLKLAAENLNINSDNFNFMSYRESIKTLTLKESCRSLNARRVNIKHKGLLPSRSDIDHSRITTEEFLKENTIIQFNIEFSKVSILAFVTNKEVQKNLQDADTHLKEGDFKNSVFKSAIAFHILIHRKGHEDKKSIPANYYYNKIDVSPIKLRDTGIGNRHIEENFKKIQEVMNRTIEVSKIIGLGVNYREYLKFKFLTPTIFEMQGNKFEYLSEPTASYSQSNSEYCFNFVVNSAIRLQNSEFDISTLLPEDEKS